MIAFSSRLVHKTPLRTIMLAILIVSGMGAGARAWAHHSFAMFDHDKTTVLSGTVRQFQWTNPHIWIQLDVRDSATGATSQWSVQMTSVNFMYRMGWRHDTLKPGDKVTLSVHPLKRGGAVGSLIRITSVNGKPFPLRAIG